ncbi:uncharacterized protein LOC118599832 isoform X1 [Oryzias melastigma]|uniref:uncharacterized protein LOC118599832 isoform X1 n=2 Tax=Oryzias melastigma TaxID=30732 RepID=UPI00168CB63A|nr:uncharacterized protein LOC118599832 isoform X1 [Oryzias melastigma]
MVVTDSVPTQKPSLSSVSTKRRLSAPHRCGLVEELQVSHAAACSLLSVCRCRSSRMKVLLFLWLTSLVCCETTEEYGNRTSDYSEDSSVTPTPEYDYDYDYNATFEADSVTPTPEPEQNATMWSEETMEEDQTSDSESVTEAYGEYDYTFGVEYRTPNERLNDTLKSDEILLQDPEPVYNSCGSITDHRSIIKALLMSLPLLHDTVMTFLHCV